MIEVVAYLSILSVVLIKPSKKLKKFFFFGPSSLQNKFSINQNQLKKCLPTTRDLTCSTVVMLLN
jgi:hypothetical protein